MFLLNLMCCLFAPHFLVCSSQDQRQQASFRSRILLPPPKTRRNSPGPKAAIWLQKQDFAAPQQFPEQIKKADATAPAITRSLY
jgi:hypothetical protein